ncbi:MAG TPA: acyl-CoA dehydrogenase family protein [Steroidobacteraceae bacterium]|jgi:alkylation response protein AidB-like acyl-CoA dehydrogenase|nr:acyl-CoA dehydrogenase family protein [Steroidobacteraceae bacterium]
MNFEFSDEQRQLHEVVERYLSDQYGFDRYRSIKNSAAGWDSSVWRGLADLGVLAITVPVAQGGLGFGPLETLAMMGDCGRSLLLEPVLSSAVIATAVLSAFAGETSAGELLTGMAAGDKIAVLAHFESDARFESRWVTTRARRFGENYRLDGHKGVVMHAAAADTLLVSARTSGEAGDARGVSLFFVPRVSPGVVIDDYPIVDGQRAADVYLQGVEVPVDSRLGPDGEALVAVEAALDIGLAALCADAVGVMQALVDATVDYVRVRQQFGQPIGRFQALQHRIADMLIHLESARSMSYLAALRCTVEDVGERRRALSAAKAVIGQAGRFIGQQAVQLHGGMGMTDEMKVSHLFKRLTAAQLMFGDSDTHLQRYATLTRGR